MGQAEFVHLHVHSHFSLLDGANKIDALFRRASELKMPAIALTDHGNLFGAVQFHDAGVDAGVKPIIGCEVYVAREGRKVRSGRSDGSNHLVLLARNQEGYRNLVKLVSLGYLEGFHYRPRIDRELLEQHSEGLIGLSACLKGIVAWNLHQDRYQEARKEAGELSEIFGKDHFYLELQDHDIEAQKSVNAGILSLAKELELPLVATNDCHYLSQEDSFPHDVLLCIQTGKTVEDTNRLRYRTDQFFLKTPEQMAQLFGHVPGALSNTLAVAEQCEFRLQDGGSVFPEFEVPAGSTLDSYFESVVREGFSRRLETLRKQRGPDGPAHPGPEYIQRLDQEIAMIQKMNFSGYFLIVWDFMRYAREQGIAVGPGRGSAAGSLVSYAMQITDVDPLQYGLLFERFLNPERVTPPDIDIDFCMHRRNQVIDYVTRKYGRDNVSQIITFGTMAARGAIRDVGRGLNIPYGEVDRIARLVPSGPDVTLKKSLEKVKELRDLIAGDERYQQLMTVAQRLEGLARHPSTHAAGIVIAPRPLIDLIPLFKSSKSDEITTQYTMNDLERLGLLKMDFLALTTLTLIEQTLEQIREQSNPEIDLDQIDLQDEETFRLFSEGRTTGIFQFESRGMREILKRLQPSRFEDLIAMNALYRPGPIQGGMIDDFVDRRHGKVRIRYEVPELEEILRETYGVIVYQEQVMQIASKLAGFSLGEADLLRRAMGKKKKKVMQGQKKKFLAGCRERGVDPKKARKIYDLIEQFAGYGFNKSHSTAYAILAYQTAWLKSHYPVQFMAALLTSEISNTDKMVQYLNECRDVGIRILPPDINRGTLHFSARGDSIQFGLAAIRNVGEAAIRSILSCRDDVESFTGFSHFLEHVDLRVLNKRVLEALIKSGAFDCLSPTRRGLLENLDRAIERGQKAQKDRLSGQLNLFQSAMGTEAMPAPGSESEEEWPDDLKWRHEKEALGHYVTGHPLKGYQAELARFSDLRTNEVSEETAGRELSIGGLIGEVKRLTTRKGDAMATFVLEDLSGSVEVLVWPKAYRRFQSLLESAPPVLLRGRCESDARGKVRILCSELVPLDGLWNGAVQAARITIPLPSLDNDKVSGLHDLVTRHPGKCPLQFELVEQESYRIRLIPVQELAVNPIPSFVTAVEDLFGKSSVTLYTQA